MILKILKLSLLLPDSDRWERKKEQEKRKRCNQRLNCNPKVTMSITVEIYRREEKTYEIKINDLINERGYLKYCKTLDEAVHIILCCIPMYGVEQIQIETNGYGIMIYDALLKQNLNIDIVPICYTGINLNR